MLKFYNVNIGQKQFLYMCKECQDEWRGKKNKALMQRTKCDEPGEM